MNFMLFQMNNINMVKQGKGNLHTVFWLYPLRLMTKNYKQILNSS